jgi:hypothetical protein
VQVPRQPRDTVDWSAWLGFNTSHGLGIFTFGLLCLLIATDDFILVERIDAIRPLTIALSAAYIGLSLRKRVVPGRDVWESGDLTKADHEI